MARRKMQKGVCRLCKKTTDLSFEHIPPKVAFNKYTKYQSIPFIEYIQNSHNPDYKPSGKLMQGGLGDYCLCIRCNSFLGLHYVPSYYRIALVSKNILLKYNADGIHFTVIELSPLKLLKQIIAMFVCINKAEFTDSNSKLLEFIKNPSENLLPEKYKVYMYLNRRGRTRSIPLMYSNHNGFLSEITFPPLGFVLSIDNSNSIPYLTEITSFKDVKLDYNDEVHFKLNVLPTYSPYPEDYRSEEEIEITVKENGNYMDLDDGE
jgi:hypothetical protein